MMTISRTFQSNHTNNGVADPRKRLHDLVNLMTESAIDCLNGGRGLNKVLFVIGHVGTALHEAFAETTLFQAGSQHGGGNLALLTVEVPVCCTAKELAIKVLDSLGVEVDRNIPESGVYQVLNRALRERQVLFLHLEDAHNLTSYETASDGHLVRDLIEALLSIPHWPLHIILSGRAEPD